jgi:c-di-GMP phosphodiesterase
LKGVSATVERPEVAVVRHPIADRRNNVVGYELRFDGAVDLGDPSRDAKATSALLVEAFGDIGLERLAGRHPAWVSIARNFLVEIGPPPVRPDRAVLQVEAYPAADDLLSLLQQLSRSGYTLALNGYDGRDDIQELMSLCSIVKVDVAGRSDEELAAAIESPRVQGALLSRPAWRITRRSPGSTARALPTTRATTSPSRACSVTAVWRRPASGRCASSRS